MLNASPIAGLVRLREQQNADRIGRVEMNRRPATEDELQDLRREIRGGYSGYEWGKSYDRGTKEQKINISQKVTASFL